MFLNFIRLSRTNLLSALSVAFFISLTSSGSVLANEQTDGLEQAKKILDSWSGQTERLIEAKNLIDVELNENPDDVHALKELARYHIMRGYKYGNVFKPGALENAEKILLKAIDKKPNFDGSYVLLGHVYEKMNKLAKAEEVLNKAEALGSDDPWLHLNLAAVLKRQKRTDEMAFRYHKVIDSGTNNIKALSTAYGYLLNESKALKDFQSVEKYYHKLFELRPDNAWSIGNYADFLRNEVGDFDKSIEYARKALEVMNYGVGHRILGLSLYAKWDDSLSKGMSAEEADVFFEEGLLHYSNLERAFAKLGETEITFPAAVRMAEMGVLVNGTTSVGYTALAGAAFDGKTDLCLKLLNLGVDPNVLTKKKHTALSVAISNGHIDTALMLLEHRDEVPKTTTTTLKHALFWAKRKNNTRMIDELSKALAEN